MNPNQKIYIIYVDDIPDEWEKSADELTDEEFIKISNEWGWHFDSWEEFILEFNRDTPYAPTPDCHYIRVI